MKHPAKKIKGQARGAWVAHSAKCPTLDFSSGHEIRVVKSSPVLGFVLSRESA